MNLIKLWKLFLSFSFKQIVNRKSPCYISDEEIIGREIFSSRHIAKSTKRVKPGAFMPDYGKPGFSVNRLLFAPIELFIELANVRARKRNRKFYGFGRISAQDIKSIYADVKGTPNFENPFHADVNLPLDAGEDLIIDLARQCSNHAYLD